MVRGPAYASGLVTFLFSFLLYFFLSFFECIEYLFHYFLLFLFSSLPSPLSPSPLSPSPLSPSPLSLLLFLFFSFSSFSSSLSLLLFIFFSFSFSFSLSFPISLSVSFSLSLARSLCLPLSLSRSGLSFTSSSSAGLGGARRPLAHTRAQVLSRGDTSNQEADPRSSLALSLSPALISPSSLRHLFHSLLSQPPIIGQEPGVRGNTFFSIYPSPTGTLCRYLPRTSPDEHSYPPHAESGTPCSPSSPTPERTLLCIHCPPPPPEKAKNLRRNRRISP